MSSHPPPPRPAGRRERAKADKRARILTAARTLLTTHGYDAMTMAQVATAADVAAGTVFQYANTKPELLLMVTTDQWRDLIARTTRTNLANPPAPNTHESTHPGRPAVAAIGALLAPIIDSSIQAPATTAAIARELLFGADGPHRRELVALVDDLERAIEQVLHAHGAGQLAPRAARLVVSGTLVELNRTREGSEPLDSVDERISDLITLTVTGAVLTRA